MVPVKAKRCILVIGTGRSGTSMVAGVLHHLGVRMGDHLVPGDNNNPKGHFECQQMRQINKRVYRSIDTGTPVTEDLIEAYRVALEKKTNDFGTTGIIGIKHPLTVHTYPYWFDFLDEIDVRVVVCRRDRDSAIKSHMLAYGTARRDAEKWHDTRHEALLRCEKEICRRNWEMFEFHFSSAVEHRYGTLLRLALIAFRDSQWLPANAALNHISPDLCHFQPEPAHVA